MKKLLFSAVLLAGTLSFATPSTNVLPADIKKISTETKTTEISDHHADLPWYTVTTVTTHWILGYPVYVTTSTQMVWYSA